MTTHYTMKMYVDSNHSRKCEYLVYIESQSHEAKANKRQNSD